MSLDSVSFTKIKTASFETRQWGKWLQKNNIVVPESCYNDLTCIRWHWIVMENHQNQVKLSSIDFRWVSIQLIFYKNILVYMYDLVSMFANAGMHVWN